jgi:hypothetical protein
VSQRCEGISSVTRRRCLAPAEMLTVHTCPCRHSIKAWLCCWHVDMAAAHAAFCLDCMDQDDASHHCHTTQATMASLS